MTPRIVIAYFAEGGSADRWRTLARVCAQSAAVHCPDWRVQLLELPAAENLYSPLGVQGNVHNTRKLDAWADVVATAADAEQILLLDADTIVRQPLDDVWDLPFDLAYTTKPETARYPFNGGVIFLRVSPAVRRFLQTWRDVNRFFLEHPLEHQVWLPPFGGINQSALGMLLRTSSDQAWPAPFKGYRHGLQVKRLPCLEWNCEDEHWDDFDPAVTRILHCKAQMQRAVFSERVDGDYRQLVAEWRAARDKEPPRRDRATRPDRDTQVTSDDLETPEGVGAPLTVRTPPPSRRQTRREQQRQGGGPER